MLLTEEYPVFSETEVQTKIEALWAEEVDQLTHKCSLTRLSFLMTLSEIDADQVEADIDDRELTTFEYDKLEIQEEPEIPVLVIAVSAFDEVESKHIICDRSGIVLARFEHGLAMDVPAAEVEF